jgi:hypothetical protein
MPFSLKFIIKRWLKFSFAYTFHVLWAKGTFLEILDKVEERLFLALFVFIAVVMEVI